MQEILKGRVWVTGGGYKPTKLEHLRCGCLALAELGADFQQERAHEHRHMRKLAADRERQSVQHYTKDHL